MGVYENGDTLGVIAGGVRRGVETENYVVTKLFKSSEVKTCVAESCNQRCRKLGKTVAKTQLEVDRMNRNENQSHPWVVDNVAAAVVYCEGMPLFGCNSEVVEGRVYEESSDFAGFEPDFMPIRDPKIDKLRDVFVDLKLGVSKTPPEIV